MHYSDAFQDSSKDDFLQVWGPDGYAQETIPDELRQLIVPLSNLEHVAMEVGCGRGTWVRLLSQLFKRVVTLDVLPKSDWLKELPNVEHHELPNKCFECLGVADESIDFAWSFGCFCHLSEKAVRSYLASINQKMKHGAHAILMFGNWSRHPAPPSAPGSTPRSCPWFYQDLVLVERWLTEAGFVDFRDLLPSHRDTLAYVRKP